MAVASRKSRSSSPKAGWPESSRALRFLTMNNQLLNDSASAGGAPVVRALTRKRVHDRTRELALASGRAAFDVTHADYLLARCDITGESDFARQEAILDARRAVRVHPVAKHAARRTARGRK